MDNIVSSIITAITTFIVLHLTIQRSKDDRMYDKIDLKADKTEVDKRLSDFESRLSARLDKHDEKIDELTKIILEHYRKNK